MKVAPEWNPILDWVSKISEPGLKYDVPWRPPAAVGGYLQPDQLALPHDEVQIRVMVMFARPLLAGGLLHTVPSLRC